MPRSPSPRALWLALPLLLMSGQPLFAQSPAGKSSKSARAIDLELQSGGRLVGQVVDPQGRPAVSDVLVWQAGRVVARVRSDEQGRFQFRGLRPGVSQLQLLGARQACRLWAPGTAPPSSPQRLLLVTGEPTTRGQRPIGQALTNPLVVAVVVSGAVAVPLSVHDRSGS